MDKVVNGLAHVGLFINDLDKEVEFYTKVLDFDCIETCTIGDMKIAFVANGSCCIELVQGPEKIYRGDGYFDHLALNVKDIEAVKAKLEERGVEFTEQLVYDPNVFAPKGSKWILFRGPEGERLELNERM